MKSYDVYFEVFGRTLKTSVQAISEEAAKEQVRSRITFHKVIQTPLKSKTSEVPPITPEMEQTFKDLFGSFSSNPFNFK